ncbi:type II toxin-antitoxin system RelE/ParE family toxin [Sphingomonas sp. LT1P40]|uniref:type II toxin-antitoxin system RelE/ParE family toxin n=1 Tax=Alteristakelama amylovorans TaxID=3096166 RepID=UPI002FC97882
MPRLDWTEPALEDLRAIEEWLSENARPEIALVTLVHIRRRARFLEEFPHGGRPIGEGIRALRVIDTPHLILYRLVGAKLQILRVQHEREDWFVEP